MIRHMDNKIQTQLSLWRKKSRLTQHRLAIMADLTPAHVCKLENGKHEPSDETLIRLAEAMNITVAQLKQEAPTLLLDK